MRCREGNKSPVIPSRLGSAGLRLAEEIANLQSFRPAAKPGKFAGNSARGDSCYPVTYTHVLNRGRLGGHRPLDRLRKPMGVETGGLRLSHPSAQIRHGGLSTALPTPHWFRPTTRCAAFYLAPDTLARYNPHRLGSSWSGLVQLVF